jgi:hypothetical protein
MKSIINLIKVILFLKIKVKYNFIGPHRYQS